MEIIKFSQNWANKLNSDVFHTFRMKNDKYKVGQIYKIELKGKHWCYAKLCLIQTTKLFDVSHYDVFMDTGMTRVEFCNLIEKMYKNYDYNPKEQLWQFLYFKKVSEAQISGFNK